MSSKLLPNGAPSDHPLPSIVELNNQCQDRHTSEENAYSNAISSAVSTSDTSFVKGNIESRVSSSLTLTEMAPPKSSHSASKVMVGRLGQLIYMHPFSHEMDRQVPLMDKIDTKVDNAASDLMNTNVRLKHTVNQLRSSRNFCIDIILLCIILGIATYLYKERED